VGLAFGSVSKICKKNAFFAGSAIVPDAKNQINSII